MELEQYKKYLNRMMNEDLSVYQNQYDIWQMLCAMQEEINILEDSSLLSYVAKIAKYARDMSSYYAQVTGSGNFDDLYWKMLLFEARIRRVDAYFLYLEKNRDPDKRFYEPSVSSL